MNKLIIASALAVMFLGAAGCNTVAGAGQDVSAAGSAVTKSADEHK